MCITDPPLHVLIAGAGIVGLTLAQGCRQNGIRYTLFERDERKDERPQGWSLLLHWCLDALERTAGPEVVALLPGATVDPSMTRDEGKFVFLNLHTGIVRALIPPMKRRMRLHRQKLREALLTGVDMQPGKRLETYEKLADGQVRAHFADGTTATGSLLVGADGNNSAVRKCLTTEHELIDLGVNILGVVRRLTPEQSEEVRAVHPLMFHGLDPSSGNYLFFSIQERIPQPDGRDSFTGIMHISWVVQDLVKDAVPTSTQERIAVMKERAQGFAEPMRNLIMDIPDDHPFVSYLTLRDWPCLPWDNDGGTVTLAGDACHPMTMFRGEGANHGILDAALLVDQLKRVRDGDVSQKEAIEAYEGEMRGRTAEAVLKSRRAALDGHVWEKITDDCPLLAARVPPATA